MAGVWLTSLGPQDPPWNCHQVKLDLGNALELLTLPAVDGWRVGSTGCWSLCSLVPQGVS